jgi:hypothetical protein
LFNKLSPTASQLDVININLLQRALFERSWAIKHMTNYAPRKRRSACGRKRTKSSESSQRLLALFDDAPNVQNIAPLEGQTEPPFYFDHRGMDDGFTAAPRF